MGLASSTKMVTMSLASLLLLMAPPSGADVAETPDFIEGAFRDPAALEAVVERAEEIAPRRIGPVYFDRQHYPDVLVIPVKELDVATASAITQLAPHAGALRVEDHPYSLSELESYAHAIGRTLRGNGVRVARIVLDEDGVLRVQVRAPLNARVQDLVTEVAPAAIVTLESVGATAGATLSHTLRTEYPPHEGALPVLVGTAEDFAQRSGRATLTGPGTCTTGFTVRKNGWRGGVTAGHCQIAPDSFAVIGAAQLGDLHTNRFWAVDPVISDSVIYEFPANRASDDVLASNDRTGLPVHVDVDSYMTHAQLPIHQDVCFTGTTTPTHRCGHIEAFVYEVEVPHTFDGNVYLKTIDKWWCNALTPLTQGGDSGGPWYGPPSWSNDVHAAGIHSGNYDIDGEEGSLAAQACFTSVVRFMSQTGWNILS